VTVERTTKVPVAPPPPPPPPAAERGPAAASDSINVCNGGPYSRGVSALATAGSAPIESFRLVSVNFTAAYKLAWRTNGSYTITIPAQTPLGTELKLSWRAVDTAGRQSATAVRTMRVVKTRLC
jgi:hypothetical protein